MTWFFSLAKQHNKTDEHVHLWVRFKRLSKRQWKFSREWFTCNIDRWLNIKFCLEAHLVQAHLFFFVMNLFFSKKKATEEKLSPI